MLYQITFGTDTSLDTAVRIVNRYVPYIKSVRYEPLIPNYFSSCLLYITVDCEDYDHQRLQRLEPYCMDIQRVTSTLHVGH